MAKVTKHESDDKETVSWSFYCPGCKYDHGFFTEGRLRWEFNEDINKPTFSPSLLNTVPGTKSRCHLHVENHVF